MFNPICETFTAFPMDFDIKKLEAEFKPPEAAKLAEVEKGPRDFLQIPYDSWPVLPMFKLQLEHLKPTFSYRHNTYMRCKYRQFLNNVPEMFVTVVPRNVNHCRYVSLSVNI